MKKKKVNVANINPIPKSMLQKIKGGNGRDHGDNCGIPADGF